MPTSTQSDFRDYLKREKHNCPNRRVRNRMHGGVGGRGCKVPSYPDPVVSPRRVRKKHQYDHWPRSGEIGPPDSYDPTHNVESRFASRTGRAAVAWRNRRFPEGERQTLLLCNGAGKSDEGI